LKTRDISPPYISEYDQAMDGYRDSYDYDLEYRQQAAADQLPWQQEPERDQPPQRAEVRPAKLARADVSPARTPGKGPLGKKGPGVVPKLQLGLDDADQEEPQRLMQTGETTGEHWCRIIFNG